MVNVVNMALALECLGWVLVVAPNDDGAAVVVAHGGDEDGGDDEGDEDEDVAEAAKGKDSGMLHRKEAEEETAGLGGLGHLRWLLSEGSVRCFPR